MEAFEFLLQSKSYRLKWSRSERLPKQHKYTRDGLPSGCNCNIGWNQWYRLQMLRGY